MGEANGKSSAFTIKTITIGFTNRLCGRPVMLSSPTVDSRYDNRSVYTH